MDTEARIALITYAVAASALCVYGASVAAQWRTRRWNVAMAALAVWAAFGAALVLGIAGGWLVEKITGVRL